MHKSFIGKHTLHKILSIIKTDLTTNHNHDHRYYTEEEVNQLLNQQKEEFINTFKVKKIRISKNDIDINIQSVHGCYYSYINLSKELQLYNIDESQILCMNIYNWTGASEVFNLLKSSSSEIGIFSTNSQVIAQITFEILYI